MSIKHRAYIAGPMTGIPQFNFPAFDECRDYLLSLGTFHVISPADMDRDDGFDETECTGHEPLTATQKQRFARNDIAALLNVDMIILLPGWQQSTGATNESKIAAWLGLDGWEYLPDAPRRERGRRITLDGSWAGKELAPIEDIQLNDRSAVLLGADAIVNGDRNIQYGEPTADFRRTAGMWSHYLDFIIEPHDVAALMALLKLSRIRWSPDKFDSWQDLAGYAACGYQARPEAITAGDAAAAEKVAA